MGPVQGTELLTLPHRVSEMVYCISRIFYFLLLEYTISSPPGPTILERPLPIDLVPGSDLTLECIAQNNVDAPNELEFYWYHNGRSVTPGSRITIDSTGENGTRVASSELVVMQVTDSDSGEYQCTVTNRDVVDGVNATSNVTVLCKCPMTHAYSDNTSDHDMKEQLKLSLVLSV